MARNHGAVDRTPGLPSYQCHICKQHKPEDAFGKRVPSGSVRSGCRQCEAERNRKAWDPDKGWAYHIRRTYGLTRADYEKMLRDQGGACAICETPAPVDGQTRFAVDHDHATGRVRGILCHLCNTALGKFRDDPRLLQRGAQYLLERA